MKFVAGVLCGLLIAVTHNFSITQAIEEARREIYSDAWSHQAAHLVTLESGERVWRWSTIKVKE